MRIEPSRCARLCASLVLWFLAASYVSVAHAIPVYFNDFQSTVGSEWSSNSTSVAPNPSWPNRRFLGEFNNDIINLSLSGLPAHDQVELTFDLFLIRSWDGSSGSAANHAYGDDLFTVSSGNNIVFRETFSNGNPAGQTYGPNPIDPYMTGASEKYSLGYIFHDVINGTIDFMDSVYHLNLRFAHAVDALRFEFSGSNLQSIEDESWGLDNVHVAVFDSTAPQQISVPSTISLLLAGLMMVMVGRRRKIV